jgi:transcriptional regulator with XRE-family HTH domain
MKTIQQRFGDRIRELRRARNISQENLAFKTGMHRTYVGGIERGERNPTLKNIEKLARTLNISLAELFTFDSKSEVKPKRRIK